MKDETGSQVRGHGITERAMAGVAVTDARFGPRLKSYRFWSMALVLFVLASCGGSGGGNSSSGSGDGSQTITSIAIEPDPVEVGRGSTRTLKVTAKTSDGDTKGVNRTDVEWESTDASIATVADGVVSGKRIGNTTVKAFLGDHTAWADVAVSALQVRPASTHLPVTCTEQMSARMVSADGGTDDVTMAADWSGSNGSVAAVDVTGKVTAKTPGSTVVRASNSGASAGALVTVGELDDLKLRDVVNEKPPSGSISLAQGEGRRLDAVGVFKNTDLANRYVTGCVTWNSSNEEVATVDQDGVITALDSPNPTTTVSATYMEGASNSLTVEVVIEVSSDSVVGLAINGPTDGTLTHGSVYQLTADAEISDGLTPVDVTPAVEWSSSDSSVITVDNDSATAGQIKGVQPGSATITAKLGGEKASETINVVSESDAPNHITVSAEPNVVLADPLDPSSICALLVPNDPENFVVPSKDIEFSVLSGGVAASFDSGMPTTGNNGEPACLDLIPKDDESGNDDYSVPVTVQAHEPVSGLTEDTVVNVVNSFSSVFGNSTSRVEPKTTDDDNDGVYTATKGTTFEAVFTNGSNRDFDIEVNSVVFCKGDGETIERIRLDADIAGDDRISGGGDILVAVTTENEHDGTGFAIGLGLSEKNTGQTFPVVHQFRETEVTCLPN